MVTDGVEVGKREGGGGGLDKGGEGLWSKTSRRGEGLKVRRNFYLECFAFMSWVIGAFDIALNVN